VGGSASARITCIIVTTIELESFNYSTTVLVIS